MSLTDEELRDVLARAEELDRASRDRVERKNQLAAVIGAAEEAGFSRQAVERALAERLNLPAKPLVAGDLAWARSTDGRYYVAQVLATSEESVQVKFLRGSEQRLTPEELRPCAFMPGVRVTCEWPMWGPWTCTVVSYDAAKQRVRLSDGWGYTKTFPVSEVWLSTASSDARGARRRLYATLLGVGAAAGALIGAIITAAVLR